MFKQGPSVGSVTPYFLSQIELPLDPNQPLAQASNLAAIETRAMSVATVLADFLGAAHSGDAIDICIYDFRLPPGRVHDTVVGAINAAAQRGVKVRIAYDKDENTRSPGTVDDFVEQGSDPAPNGTDAFLGNSTRFDRAVLRKGIAAPTTVALEGIDPKGHIMHNKFVLRRPPHGPAAVLMGSANFTLDAWATQENNVLVIDPADGLAAQYLQDFEDMWSSGVITQAGANAGGSVEIVGIDDATVLFAPGRGRDVEALVARTVLAATRRVVVASMDLSSGAILDALLRQAQQLGSAFRGLYDGPSMATVERDWSKGTASRQNRAPAQNVTPATTTADKVRMWQALKPQLVAKRSIPYSNNAPHNLMHDKVVVADDTVVTGSFNFSNNATKNAENVVVLRSAALAEQFVNTIDALVARYRASP